jgi:hypothetical protein
MLHTVDSTPQPDSDEVLSLLNVSDTYPARLVLAGVPFHRMKRARSTLRLSNGL